MKNSDIAAVLAILLIILSCFFLIWLTDHSDETDDGNVNISGGETPETGSDLSEDNEDEEKTPTLSYTERAYDGGSVTDNRKSSEKTDEIKKKSSEGWIRTIGLRVMSPTGSPGYPTSLHE